MGGGGGCGVIRDRKKKRYGIKKEGTLRGGEERNGEENPVFVFWNLFLERGRRWREKKLLLITWWLRAPMCVLVGVERGGKFGFFFGGGEKRRFYVKLKIKRDFLLKKKIYDYGRGRDVFSSLFPHNVGHRPDPDKTPPSPRTAQGESPNRSRCLIWF